MRPTNPIPNVEMETAMARRQIGTMKLAAQLGMSYSALSMVKRGWRYPSREQGDRIEAALGTRGLFRCYADEETEHEQNPVSSVGEKEAVENVLSDGPTKFRSQFADVKKPVSNAMTQKPDPTQDDWGIIAKYDDGHREVSTHMTMTEAVYWRDKHARKRACILSCIIYIPFECVKFKKGKVASG